MRHGSTDFDPPEDVTACLKAIQEDLSWELTPKIYHAARRNYILREDRSAANTPLAMFVERHREVSRCYWLHDAYLRIARHYRDTAHPHGQRMLQFDDTAYEELLRQEWERFYLAEVRRLIEQDDAAVLAILSAALYIDEEPGEAAGAFLLALLDFRYTPR